MKQKRHPGPWLTSWSKPRAAHCQHHAERAIWKLAYKLFKTQTILLSTSCRNGLLDPDLQPIQIQRSPLSEACRNGLLDTDLHSVQNPNHSTVSIMQRRLPGPRLTRCSKSRTAHSQHHAENISWTLTYNLFKTQTILLSASWRKGLLNPDLHAVQNPEQPIVSIVHKRPPGLWLTTCSEPRAAHCQHHTEKTLWTPTYSLIKAQTIVLSASSRIGILELDLQPDQSTK